jgi:hypothetical protein
MNQTLIYSLLLISLATNIVLLFRIQQVQKKLKKLQGGVELSREELEQLKDRLQKLKYLR